MHLKALSSMLLLLVFFAEEVAWSYIAEMKQPCANCHTMHNSQGGDSDVTVGNIGVQGALLINSCYGCHTGSNAGSTNSNPKLPKVLHLTPSDPPSAPYVTTGTESGHDTLAGGDFGWVEDNDLNGHNVNIPGLNQATRNPPGNFNNAKTFDADNPLRCAGTYGCHGLEAAAGEINAMYQTHHALPQTQPMDGSTLIKSYRWLDGIAGYEDPDYELTVSSSDHNQYKGINRTGDTDDNYSISHLCARCHENFHFGTGNLGVWDGTTWSTDPWIRHPVDYNMGLAGEFATYGGTSNAYNVITPVGSVVVTSVLSTVTGSDDTIIVCVSCHRAHGSPYAYGLRWDYNSWPGGTNAYNGCGDCHTALN